MCEPSRSWTTSSRWTGWRRRRIRCWRATRRSASSPVAPSDFRLRLLVTGVTYRHPGLLAKTVTTLDVAVRPVRPSLGIGAAWYEREHRALGVPYPPVAERFERLEEAIQICLQMWQAQTTVPVQRVADSPARRDSLL